MGCGGEEPPVTKAAVGLVTLKGLWNPGLFGTQHFTEDSDAQGGFHALLPTEPPPWTYNIFYQDQKTVPLNGLQSNWLPPSTR